MSPLASHSGGIIIHVTYASSTSFNIVHVWCYICDKFVIYSCLICRKLQVYLKKSSSTISVSGNRGISPSSLLLQTGLEDTDSVSRTDHLNDKMETDILTVGYRVGSDGEERPLDVHILSSSTNINSAVTVIGISDKETKSQFEKKLHLHFPPKKRGRDLLHTNDVDFTICKKLKNKPSKPVLTRQVVPGMPEVVPVPPPVRRSGRDRKVSARVAKDLDPESKGLVTRMLAGTSSTCDGQKKNGEVPESSLTAVNVVKRGRGRPKKVVSTSDGTKTNQCVTESIATKSKQITRKSEHITTNSICAKSVNTRYNVCQKLVNEASVKEALVGAGVERTRLLTENKSNIVLETATYLTVEIDRNDKDSLLVKSSDGIANGSDQAGKSVKIMQLNDNQSIASVSSLISDETKTLPDTFILQNGHERDNGIDNSWKATSEMLQVENVQNSESITENGHAITHKGVEDTFNDEQHEIEMEIVENMPGTSLGKQAVEEAGISDDVLVVEEQAVEEAGISDDVLVVNDNPEDEICIIIKPPEKPSDIMKNLDQYIRKEEHGFVCEICGKVATYKANMKGKLCEC